LNRTISWADRKVGRYKMGGLAGIIQHTVAFDRGDKAGGRFKQINSPRRYEDTKFLLKPLWKCVDLFKDKTLNVLLRPFPSWMCIFDCDNGGVNGVARLSRSVLVDCRSGLFMHGFKHQEYWKAWNERCSRKGQGGFDSQAPALVVIHKYLRDAVVLAGMPEPRHREVTLCVTQVPVESPSYRPCRYDDSETHWCITTRAPVCLGFQEG